MMPGWHEVFHVFYVDFHLCGVYFVCHLWGLICFYEYFVLFFSVLVFWVHYASCDWCFLCVINGALILSIVLCPLYVMCFCSFRMPILCL